MLSRMRHLPADVWHWIATHRLVVLLAVLCVAIAAGAAAWLITRDDDTDELEGVRPAPNVLIGEVRTPEETEDLGFPGFATKNTTRVAGADAVANAAAVALAVHPSAGGVEGPAAVSLVDGEWTTATAAASLVADPVGAPILVGAPDEVPELTANTLDELDPGGSGETAGRQVLALGDVEVPRGLDALELDGADPAQLAAEAADLRRRLAGKPQHVVVTGYETPEFGVPAAAWAARSGDPVLFVERDEVPEATRDALREAKDTPVYVLGPPEAVNAKTFDEIEKLAPGARRIAGDDPVANAIEFSRFAEGSFGWDINDPGHGFVVAATDRPVDAAVAAPLSASGTWGPLLLNDDADALAPPLRGYLLDLKPGYDTDPTRALYNHIWLIGDADSLSIGLQAQVDELAEVAPVSSGSGSAPVDSPGAPESQPDDEPADDDKPAADDQAPADDDTAPDDDRDQP